MSINATTLTNAIGANDTVVTVGSATGITAPNFQTGSGITYLYMGSELMLVTGLVSGTLTFSVNRGIGGTVAVAHAASIPVFAGLPADFPNFTPAQRVEVQEQPNRFLHISPPVVSAATITASGPYFHLTGTTQLVNMNPPTGMVAGQVTIVFDGSGSGLTWTTGGTAGIAFAVAGTATTAASTVTFTLDPSTGLWHPSRLA